MDGETVRQTPVAAWGDQGRLRNWFHTRTGARFLNAQTAWFRIHAPSGWGLLTTTGRRTGALRRSSVRVVTVGQRGFMVAIGGETTDWLKNVLFNPRVSLRVGDRTRTGHARRPQTENEQATAVTAYCETITWFDFVSSVVNQRGFPSPKRIRALLARWFEHGAVLVIDFDAP
jgi:deazaflavin-dependent oxidoreductase (nitroreductase family)